MRLCGNGRTADTMNGLENRDIPLIRERRVLSPMRISVLLSQSGFSTGGEEKAERGELLFGTVEVTNIWKMTGGAKHLTDYLNTARTRCFNINTLDWDDESYLSLDIPRVMLPKPVPCAGDFGETILGYLEKVPITGRQRSAELHSLTCELALTKAVRHVWNRNFLLPNTINKPVYSSSGLLTTIGRG